MYHGPYPIHGSMPIRITPDSGLLGIAEALTVLTLPEPLPQAATNTPSAAVSAPQTSARLMRNLMIDLPGGCLCQGAHAPPRRALETPRGRRARGLPASSRAGRRRRSLRGAGAVGT